MPNLPIQGKCQLSNTCLQTRFDSPNIFQDFRDLSLIFFIYMWRIKEKLQNISKLVGFTVT